MLASLHLKLLYLTVQVTHHKHPQQRHQTPSTLQIPSVPCLVARRDLLPFFIDAEHVFLDNLTLPQVGRPLALAASLVNQLPQPSTIHLEPCSLPHIGPVDYHQPRVPIRPNLRFLDSRVGPENP